MGQIDLVDQVRRVSSRVRDSEDTTRLWRFKGKVRCQKVADRRLGNQMPTESCSALLVVVTQLLDAIADSIADTKTAKEPVIRVTTVVVYGAAVATVVITVLASRSSRGLLAEVALGGARRRGFFSHLGWTGRVVVFVKVGSVRVASWGVRVRFSGLGELRGSR